MPAATADAALGVLGRALTDAPEPDSHVRLFLDEGAPMLALLRDAAETADRRAMRRGHACGRWARRAARPGPGSRPTNPRRSSPWPTR